MAKFKIGNKVVLDIPTSPVMIVEFVNESRGRIDCDCIWFVDGIEQRRTYDEDLLLIYNPIPES